MGILDNIFGQAPRKAPSLAERKYNEEMARSSLLAKRQQSNKKFQEIEAQFGTDFINEQQNASPERLEELNSIKDIQNPEFVDFITLYGFEKGSQIAYNETLAAQALLGGEAGVMKEFDFKNSTFTKIDGEGFLKLPVKVTNTNTGESYDNAPITKSRKDAVDVNAAGGEAAVKEDMVELVPISLLNDGYKSVKGSITGAIGGNVAGEYIKDIPAFSEKLNNDLFSEAGGIAAFFKEVDAGTGLTPTDDGSDKPPGTTEEGQTELAINESRINVLNSLDPTVAYSEEEIAEWPSGGTAIGGLSKSRKYKSVYIANQNAIQKLQNKGELSAPEQGQLNRLLKSQQDTLNGIKQSAQNSYDALVKIENAKEAKLTEEITSLQNQLKGKVSDQNRAKIEAQIEAKTNERDGITAELGTKLPTELTTSTNKDLKKEGFSLTPTQRDAFKTAIFSGDEQTILAAINTITGGKPPSNELQKKIVSYLQKAQNNIRLVGLQKQVNEGIVMAMISADPKLMSENMDAIISMAQFGVLDFQAQTNRMTAETGRMNAKREGTDYFRNEINKFKVFNDDGSLNTDLTELNRYGTQAIENNDAAGKLAYEVTASQWIKEWAQANGKVSFWRKIASFGQASGPDAAKFSIKANIRLVDRGDGRPYFEFLDQNGAITGARIGVFQAGKELGPAGLELLMAMAGENKEPE
tara:strand:+ start:3040 stop:5124 length:2085 start_codon:yes stop_codon:yes gene_type:complete